MSAQTDYYHSLDRAASLTMDAATALRALKAARIPEHHRRLAADANRKLEWAQQILFQARNEPWNPPLSAPRQLELIP